MLANILPEAEALDDAGTLAYLHGTISDKRHPVAVPAIPTHLDAILCDTPFLGGVEPKLGNQHLRALTVLGFPNATTPGILDALNDLGFAYRWTTRWIAIDKTEATRQLTRLRRQWFAKRKSVSVILREVMFNRETALVDPDADNKAADADEALQELGQDDVAFGFLTTTVIVGDADPKLAGDKLLAIERIINGRGFVTIRETLNAVEAWLGSLPGNPYANVRQPIVHSLNLAHMMPVSAVWAGPEFNRHLNAPTLMMTETRGSTPFRLDLHVGDVGHALMVGPTGAGKSVLLALLALQFRRFIGAQVVLFDRGRSARAAALAMGGESIELGLEGTLSLQPLARIDEPGEIAFALQWITALLTAEGVRVTPDVKDAVWTALRSLASAPKQERTLTGLAVLIQSNALVAGLTPYTLEGAYGRLLDGASEALATTDVLHFEMEHLMQHKALIAPVLTYLFHRLEARFDGRPTLLILDEAWTFLDDAIFAARIREWLKTLRKKNVAVVFATQSLADIERSSIAPALIESCPTRIFLPNDRALEPQARSVYERFGLNARQIEILSLGRPQARLLRPDRARQSPVRAWPGTGGAGVVRGLLARRPAPHRPVYCRRRSNRLRCTLSRSQRIGVGGRTDRTLASAVPAAAYSTCHQNRSGRRCAHSRATPARPDTFAEGSGATRRTPHRRGAAAWPSRWAAVVGTPVALPGRPGQSQEERSMRHVHRIVRRAAGRRRRTDKLRVALGRAAHRVRPRQLPGEPALGHARAGADQQPGAATAGASADAVAHGSKSGAARGHHQSGPAAHARGHPRPAATRQRRRTQPAGYAKRVRTAVPARNLYQPVRRCRAAQRATALGRTVRQPAASGAAARPNWRWHRHRQPPAQSGHGPLPLGQRRPGGGASRQ